MPIILRGAATVPLKKQNSFAALVAPQPLRSFSSLGALARENAEVRGQCLVRRARWARRRGEVVAAGSAMATASTRDFGTMWTTL